MENNFAEILKRERRERGLSQRELAQMAGCTNPAIAYYETGKRKPSLEMADKLLSALGVAMVIGKED